MVTKTSAIIASRSRPGASGADDSPCPETSWESFFYEMFLLDHLRRQREAEEARLAHKGTEGPAGVTIRASSQEKVTP